MSKSDDEIKGRVRDRFPQDTSGERVDGYLLRDNSDGTVSIAITQNIEEFVLTEVRLAMESEARLCAMDACAWCLQGLPVLRDCIMGWHHAHNDMQVTCYAGPIWSRRERETKPNKGDFQ